MQAILPQSTLAGLTEIDGPAPAGKLHPRAHAGLQPTNHQRPTVGISPVPLTFSRTFRLAYLFLSPTNRQQQPSTPRSTTSRVNSQDGYVTNDFLNKPSYASGQS